MLKGGIYAHRRAMGSIGRFPHDRERNDQSSRTHART